MCPNGNTQVMKSRESQMSPPMATNRGRFLSGLREVGTFVATWVQAISALAVFWAISESRNQTEKLNAQTVHMIRTAKLDFDERRSAENVLISAILYPTDSRESELRAQWLQSEGNPPESLDRELRRRLFPVRWAALRRAAHNRSHRAQLEGPEKLWSWPKPGEKCDGVHKGATNQLAYLDLSPCDASDEDFSWSDLDHADLRHCDLTHSDLHHCTLHDTKFGPSYSDVDFYRSFISGDWSGVKKMKDCNFSGTTMEGVLGLHPDVIRDPVSGKWLVYFDTTTVWPKDLRSKLPELPKSSNPIPPTYRNAAKHRGTLVN